MRNITRFKTTSSRLDFKKISKTAIDRKKTLNKVLQKRVDGIVDKLDFNPDAQLTKREVYLVLDLLGIELNCYQRSELEANVNEISSNKISCFNVQSLKNWIMRNRNFIVCKVIGVNAIKPDSLNDIPERKNLEKEVKTALKLPDINKTKRNNSCQRSGITNKINLNSYMEAMKDRKSVV